mgnify:CR=1 FL=1
MTRITVIRHSQLEEPFDNYDELGYIQLDGLATGTIQPRISRNTANLIEQSHYLDEKFDVILHSPSSRAMETAEEIVKMKVLNQIKLLSIDEIDEIKFTISNLITKSEYKKLGLQPLRDRFYKAIGENQAGIEPLESIYKRIQVFEDILKDMKDKNILVISHGFFMKYIKSYFYQESLGKLPEKKVLQRLVEKSNDRYDYLSGFSVTI